MKSTRVGVKVTPYKAKLGSKYVPRSGGACSGGGTCGKGK